MGNTSGVFVSKLDIVIPSIKYQITFSMLALRI